MADKKLGSDLGGKLDGCLLGEASSPCLLCDVSVLRRRAMSLSSTFRAVGNDPGIITWRIEVSGAGGTPHTFLLTLNLGVDSGHPGLLDDTPPAILSLLPVVWQQ